MDDLDVVRLIGELADQRHRPGRSRAGMGRAEGEMARPRGRSGWLSTGAVTCHASAAPGVPPPISMRRRSGPIQ